MNEKIEQKKKLGPFLKRPKKTITTSESSRAFLSEMNITKIGHSFLNVNNKLYALQPMQYLGSGGFGAVKKCFNEKGEAFAVKIKFGIPNAEDETEQRVLTLLERNHGQITRIIQNNTDTKQYGIQGLIPGIDLFSYLKANKKKLPEATKYYIGYECAKRIQSLHGLGLVHGDIAPRNFMINALGYSIDDILLLEAIDFGLTQEVNHEPSTIKTKLTDSGEQSIIAAPEDSFKIDFAFDVYMLGNSLFHDGLEIDHIYNNKDMLADSPNMRPEIADVVNGLREKLLSLGVDPAKLESIPETSANSFESLSPEVISRSSYSSGSSSSSSDLSRPPPKRLALEEVAAAMSFLTESQTIAPKEEMSALQVLNHSALLEKSPEQAVEEELASLDLTASELKSKLNSLQKKEKEEQKNLLLKEQMETTHKTTRKTHGFYPSSTKTPHDLKKIETEIMKIQHQLDPLAERHIELTKRKRRLSSKKISKSLPD